MSDLKNKRIISVATTGAWPKKENRFPESCAP